MTKFAKNTIVTVAQTRGDIQSLLGKYGGTPFDEYDQPHQAVVMFDANGYHMRFNLPLPHTWQQWTTAGQYHNNPTAQEVRSRWRALHLCIKAKLEAIESGIETFEEAFFAHIVGSTGQTMGEEHLALLPPKEYQKEEIVCQHCKKRNRIPIGRKLENATCGYCHRPLLRPVRIEHNSAMEDVE